MLRNLSLLLLLASIPLLAQPAPTVNAVVSAAGEVTDVSPGGIATVWGLDFAAEPASAGVLPLPVTLGATSVTINGVESPLFYVPEFQINLQIPFETPTDIEVEVIVTRDGLSSDAFTLIVRADAISIFPTSAYPGPASSNPSCCTRTESRW